MPLGCYSIRARWACIYTHPQAEFWAASNLRSSGYQPYLPTHLARQRDRAVPTLFHSVTRPLFPRYLFVPFDHLTASWSPIRATPGVCDILRSGGEPSYVSEAVVSALQTAEAFRATHLPDAAQWASGDAVVVSGGAACGMRGAIVKVDRERAVVLLQMFGAFREVDLPLRYLQPVVEVGGLDDDMIVAI